MFRDWESQSKMRLVMVTNNFLGVLRWIGCQPPTQARGVPISGDRVGGECDCASRVGAKGE